MFGGLILLQFFRCCYMQICFRFSFVGLNIIEWIIFNILGLIGM